MAKARKKPAATMVELTAKGKKEPRQFVIAHALRLLQLPNTAWELTDTKFEFVNNDIKRRASKATNKGTKE